MLEMKIKIEADAAVLKAIDKLTTALEKNAVNISVSQDTPTPVAPVATPVTHAPVPPVTMPPVTMPPATVVPTQPTPAPVATPTPAPAPATPAQTVAPTNPAPTVPVTTAPTYTLDQIAKAGASLVDAGKMEQLLALIAKCILNGGKVNIKTAAAGDGGGEYYEPTVAQTALRGKKWEGDVASAAVSTTNANMIDVKITIDDSVGGFTIREMGLFDDDGTLIAICNTPDTEKVSTDGGVSGKLTMIMHIVVADASVVSFTITPALDTVSRAEMESALAEHNTNGTSHSDIRALALNAVQQGDVYTKPEVNALVGGAVNEHNNSDTAHASIRVDLTGLDSRLKTLELKYGTNVTGSSFEVTFVTLTDVVVTGVWNEELGRIEF